MEQNGIDSKTRYSFLQKNLIDFYLNKIISVAVISDFIFSLNLSTIFHTL